MALLVWDGRFSVGVGQIDGQHMELVKMINELHDAMVEKKGKEVLRGIIDRMVEYAVAHFALEELEMQRLAYPPYPAHKAQHEVFTRKAHELQERSNAGTLVLSLEVINFLKDWLVTHIMSSDQALGAFIVARGKQTFH